MRNAADGRETMESMKLYELIMNLPCAAKALTVNLFGGSTIAAYALGHRDARHAAAELALAVDAEIEQLRASVAAIHCRLTHGSFTAGTVQALIDECEHALPALDKLTRSQRMAAAVVTPRPSGKTAGGLMLDE